MLTYMPSEGPRAVVLILAAVVGFSACAGGRPASSDAPDISQNQKTLRTEASRVRETVSVPAVIGAVGGAVLGGLLCDKEKAACAVGGAAAGGLIGGGAGYLVALQNEKFANREEELQARTNAAKRETERFDRLITATNGVITEHKQEIALLRQRYRAGRALKSDYQKQVSVLNDDIGALKINISANQKNIDAINKDLERLGRDGTRGLSAERDKLVRQKNILEKQLAVLTGLTEGALTS